MLKRDAIETPEEFSVFNWGHDIVQATIDLVRELDPPFELPEGFFKGNPYLPVMNGANGVNGAKGANGANGTHATNGMNGANGANGANGVSGVNGANGTSHS